MNGAPAKPISGTLQLAAQQADRLEHVGELLARLEASQRGDVGRRRDRRLDHRALALVEVEGNPERRERHQQVGEEDGGVEGEGADRLQRDLDGQLWRPAHLEHRVLLAQRPVLGHVPPGLPHEPDGRAVHRLTPTGPDKPIVHGHMLPGGARGGGAVVPRNLRSRNTVAPGTSESTRRLGAGTAGRASAGFDPAPRASVGADGVARGVGERRARGASGRGGGDAAGRRATQKTATAATARPSMSCTTPRRLPPGCFGSLSNASFSPRDAQCVRTERTGGTHRRASRVCKKA